MKKLIIATAMILLAAPVMADSLVLFKNGKAMRVKAVTKDGDWLKCEFEDKNFISVPASGVLKVEEAVVGGTAGELRPNQVAAGTGGSYVPGPRGGGDPGQPEAPPVEEDPAVVAADQEDALRQQALAAGTPLRGTANLNNRRGGGRGIPIPPGTNPGVQQGLQNGLQPLNQAGTPFQNRSLSQQRGLNRNRVPIPTNNQGTASADE